MSKKPDLTIKFCGLDLQTPLVLLSGCVGFGNEYTRVEGFSNADIGAVILKGTTLEPRSGNPPHRVYETPSGMLNAIGLQNPGCSYIIKQILPELPHHETQFWANINGSSIEEYVEVTRLFDDSPVTAMEVNISCPNVKAGGIHFGSNVKMSAQLVQAMRAVTNKPLITKLSPANADITAIGKACIEAGTDAFSLINTLPGMAIDIQTRKPVLANISGGLSGPAIKPVALWKIYQLRQLTVKHDIPLLGQGGIAHATDAIEFAIAGSDTIGLGTGLFYDPLLPEKILTGLTNYLTANSMGSYAKLVGTLDIPA
ncbi:MAG: dihydroorotate dehydrogenase [Mariprofundaceae bacterium]